MTLHLLILTAASTLHYWLIRHEAGVQPFPDGTRYLAAGRGVRLHRPFHLRWLLPWLLKDDPTAWRRTTSAATIALAPLTYLWLLTMNVAPDVALVGALLVPGLPGVFRMNAVGFALVDAVALALILVASSLFNVGEPLAGLGVAIIAATVKESSPAFIALLAGEPLALTAFGAVAIRHGLSPSSDADLFDERSRDILRRPLHYGLEFHRAAWLDWRMMLAPWGAAVVGIAALPSLAWHHVALVAVAYAQTLVATDTVRLYQYAFPVMILGAVTVLPIEWAALIVAAHWLSPWRRVAI